MGVSFFSNEVFNQLRDVPCTNWNNNQKKEFCCLTEKEHHCTNFVVVIYKH